MKLELLAGVSHLSPVKVNIQLRRKTWRPGRDSFDWEAVCVQCYVLSRLILHAWSFLF